MAWTSLGAIRSGWQNDISTLVRGYYDNVNQSARTVDMTVDVYMSTTNGRFLSANVSGNGYIAGDGPTDTKAFTAAANADTGFTNYTRSISYNANGEAVVTWGGWLRANNVLTFDQSIYTASNLPSIPPLALTSLSVSRVSDTQHTVAWSIPAGVTNTEVVVQRRTDDGGWTQVGRPAGNVASWVDTSTSAGHKYEYRVAGIRSGRQAAWTGTVTVYTTPAPPASVSAEKVGSNIAVTAAGLPPYATAYDIQESQNGGAWADLQTGVTSWPWTHTSPNSAVTHAYRVRATRGALASAYSGSSNVVQLLAAPNAPTLTSPNGATLPAGTVRFEWIHNAIDTTAQTAYEMRYRLVGAPSWTTLSGTTATFRDVALTANATDYEWQARTKGQHANWSPWSSVATMSVISIPGVAITQPGSSWGQPVLPVTWTWTQAQGRPQSAWKLRLLDAASNLIKEHSGSGDTAAFTPDPRLTTGQTYIIQVQAATGNVWSTWASQTFDTLFVPPAAPAVTSEWSEATGAMTLVITEVAGPVAVVSFDVERSTDGGTTWTTVLTGATLDGSDSITYEDYECLSCGATMYRVTAWAASGAAASTEHEAVSDSLAVWLGGGLGFANCARLPFSPSVNLTAGRARSLQRYEGRSHGVPYAGEQLAQVVEVSGRLLHGDPDVASVAAMIDVAQDKEPLHLVRDPDGRCVAGVLSQVRLPRQSGGIWGYGFTVEEAAR